MREKFKNVEQELFVLLCRLTFEEEKVNKIRSIVQSSLLNWGLVFYYALLHKASTLVFYNIQMLELQTAFPKYLREILVAAGKTLEHQNKLYIAETERIIEECKKYDIIVAPVKGAYLIPKLYQDYRTRFMGDIDLLVKKRDIQSIKDIMKKMGYVQGYFDRKAKKIRTITREEELFWKLNMSNLYPYVKTIENEYLEAYKVDFRFSLDDSRNESAVNEMLDSFHNKQMRYEYYLIHLCTHLYNEAIKVQFVKWGKDLNLIKFCDIREFIHKFCDDEVLYKAILFAQKYNYEKAMFYVFYYLGEIYEDGYEKDILKKLNIDEDSLNTYKIYSIDKEKSWKTDFWVRFFKDE